MAYPQELSSHTCTPVTHSSAELAGVAESIQGTGRVLRPIGVSRSSYTAPAEARGQRLDAWLTTQLENVSRARVQLLLSESKILVDGATGKPSLKLRGGETVEIISEAAPPPLHATPEAISLDVIYEDEDLSVINKPAGMMVHAGSGASEDARNRGTLVNALLSRYAQLSRSSDPLRPGIVHRLDKHTSCLNIAARN